MPFRFLLAILAIVSLVSPSSRAQDGVRRTLEYAAAPVDNPLKGLVPYAGVWKDRFPHSMEFDYLPFSALVKGYDTFDWKPLDAMLDAIAGRGHQAVMRIYLEYPNKADGLPPFLLADGLKVHKYRNTQAKPAEDNITPDYADPRLRKLLRDFIAAFGKKYDGDPRIGFLTAGLLGHWGEWHTWPREELFAKREVQTEVMDAYEKAFRKTRVLLRYPVGPKHESLAANATRPFGYHDDSFAWGTLDTGRKDDSWFYMPSLKLAGAVDKWKTQPIGGEIRPEAWGRVFDDDPKMKQVQNFTKCVAETHATWLMDTGMFEKKQTAARTARATREVQRMGYEYHIPAVNISAPVEGKRAVVVEVENRGVAPFYHDWPVEFGLTADGKVVKAFVATGKLSGILPGEPARRWSDTLDLMGIAGGRYKLAIRVPNPMPKGRPLRFANATQDADLEGWLTLGEIEVK